MLPPMPGIYVDGVGDIRLPLVEEEAKRLISQCSNESACSNYDESKLWQLGMDKVTMKNPLWETGMKQLGDTISGVLGYEFPLEICPQKLAVHEAGDEPEELDVEMDNKTVAVLVVQPPSAHEGGTLVVDCEYESFVEYSVDFGKTSSAVTFSTHFAVFSASAKHKFEPVTSGYRLAIVYTVRVPLSFSVDRVKRQ